MMYRTEYATLRPVLPNCNSTKSVRSPESICYIFYLENNLNIHTDQDIRARSQEEVDLLTWLSPLNFSTKQNDIFAMRQKGTGKWFLSDDLFQAWLDGTERTLWCPGIRM